MGNGFFALAQSIPCRTGIKREDHFSKLISEESLLAAFSKVKSKNGGPGLDGVTAQMFESNLSHNIADMQTALLRGTYRPLPPRPFRQQKTVGSCRTLAIPAIKDRVVQRAILETIQPLLHSVWDEASFARPSKSSHDALRTVAAHLQHSTHVVRIDIKDCYDSIGHSKLRHIVRRCIDDERIVDLLNVSVMKSSRGVGLLQGSVLSPLLANLFLTVVDKSLRKSGCCTFVRYVDDLFIACATRRQAQKVYATTRQILSKLELPINTKKSGIFNVSTGFDFLGHYLSVTDQLRVTASQKSIERFQAKVQARLAKICQEECQQTKHYRLQVLAARLNPYLRGWETYYKFLDRDAFESLDEFVCEELRKYSVRRDEHLFGKFFFIMAHLRPLGDMHVNILDE